MNVRYPRQTTYLQEISNMQVIDLLFDTMRSTRTSDVIPRGLSPSRQSSNATMAAVNNMPQHQLPSSHNSLTYQSARSLTSISNRVPPPQAQNPYADTSNRIPSSSMIRLQIPARESAPATAASLRMATQRFVSYIDTLFMLNLWVDKLLHRNYYVESLIWN